MFYSKAHKVRIIIIFILLLISFIVASLFLIPYADYSLVKPDWNRIDFDVKLYRLNTNIDVYKNNVQIGKVKGKVLRLFTDPLTYYDMNGEKIGFADDTYHIIAQDSHTMKVGNTITAEMVGKVKVIGEGYSIFDSNGIEIAFAEFNFTGLSGKMTDMHGVPIAIYRASPIQQDFSVYYSNECEIDEDTLVMIFASYYSDHHIDSTNNSD